MAVKILVSYLNENVDLIVLSVWVEHLTWVGDAEVLGISRWDKLMW